MSTPFRERNPVIIGAVSLAVIAALILAAFKAAGPAADRRWRHLLRRLHRGRRPQGQRRGPGRRRPRRQGRGGRARRRPRAGRRSRSTSDAEFGAETAAAIKVKTLLGAMYLALEPAGSRPDGGGARRSRSSAPPRRTTSSRRSPGWPRRSERIDTDQLAKSLNTLGRPDPQHPRGVPRGAATACPRLSANVAARDEQLNTLLQQPREGLRGARRPRRGHHRADAGRRRAVPGARRSAARRSTTCWSSTSPAVEQLTAPGPGDAAPTSSRPWTTSRASSTC